MKNTGISYVSVYELTLAAYASASRPRRPLFPDSSRHAASHSRRRTHRITGKRRACRRLGEVQTIVIASSSQTSQDSPPFQEARRPPPLVSSPHPLVHCIVHACHRHLLWRRPRRRGRKTSAPALQSLLPPTSSASADASAATPVTPPSATMTRDNGLEHPGMHTPLHAISVAAATVTPRLTPPTPAPSPQHAAAYDNFEFTTDPPFVNSEQFMHDQLVFRHHHFFLHDGGPPRLGNTNTNNRRATLHRHRHRLRLRHYRRPHDNLDAQGLKIFALRRLTQNFKRPGGAR
ncbi:hypothetical protein F5148DRAFT_435 [Russula earlei]|uniref:Uncharacterized protein n=1 Tax=Russula earlei TaxID=71964 RepID=A0ACC0UQL7_9AGAM|nr:hypothetical protein F5148DRAFT_435 [Russula earlei]